MYAAIIVAGSVLAVVAMQWALFSRLLNRLRSACRIVDNAGAVQRCSDVECFRGFDFALGDRSCALHRRGCLRFARRRDDELVAWALVVMYVVMTFFALVSFGPASPFAPGATVPVGFDGPGPNPLLQNHILVLFHPPLLYLGYIGFTVPFAFAIAALITGRVGEGWLLETRRWALLSWGLLTIGILLGGWWSYEVLGWSGVWAWDPVENAGLLPWLTGTAYIHSVLVQQRRGMLRVWNLSLLVATFALTILGTFLAIWSYQQRACLCCGRDRWLLAWIFRCGGRRVIGFDRLAR